MANKEAIKFQEALAKKKLKSGKRQKILLLGRLIDKKLNRN